MEFSYRMSKTDKVKTVCVIMDDTDKVMAALDPDKVHAYFEYGFKVDMQGIARKKGNVALLAHLTGLGLEAGTDEGVEVKTQDATATAIKNASPEKRAEIEAFMREQGLLA
ncbi:hypothetical protein LCGC14_1845830 [marine sediment metagenome]|uniref:Uncharacterized protein n=1 Tax=marine sediment metagenome TaxID=412755 RepID=A0A0F9GBT4_9ZZZZ